MQERVFITGIGIICAVGGNAEETLHSLREGRTGIGEITHFDTLHRGTLPLAEVKKTTGELLEMTGFTGRRDLTRTTLLGMIAAREAMASAGITPADGVRTGLVSATTVGGMDRSECFYREFLDNPAKGKLIEIVHHDCGDSTERIAAFTGIGDFVTTISTACSSSVNALMFGANLIRSGQLDRVLVGGTDSVTRFTLNGFNTLMILDRTGCHPFDDNRAGLTLGEGAAYLVLEPEHAVQRSGKKVLAEVKGYGNANDAYHQTASSPDGTGAFLAMTKAIAMSGLAPDEIDYINVHGTGTQNNDLSEGIALQRIFGDQVPLFSSTKGFTGHTLGAAGAVEAVISVLALKHQLRFPNPGFSAPMKELAIRPITMDEFSGRAPRDPRFSRPVRHVLSNSFGFGGNNSSVILSEAPGSLVTRHASRVTYPVPAPAGSSPVFITGVGIVSPQAAAFTGGFPGELQPTVTDRLVCPDPGYKEYIPADLIRRMGRIIKMGVTAARRCLQDSGRTPDSIITGTGMGCMEDTEKFLASMIRNREELLTPTSFIQSTHNTVAGQIALILQCHRYNFTYVHRGVSFEHALTDALLQLRSGAAMNVLAGGTDELSPGYHAITARMGFWKQKPVNTFQLYSGQSRGAIAGEGAAFFLLEPGNQERAYARLDGVTTFLKPDSRGRTGELLQAFLADHGIGCGDIGLALLGMNGDPRSDEVYRHLAGRELHDVPLGFFKHLSGEYPTASSFALWLASMILKTGEIPPAILSPLLPGTPGSPVTDPKNINRILIYNHFRNNNHSFFLLSRP